MTPDVVAALLARTRPVPAEAPAGPGLYAWWAPPAVLPALGGPVDGDLRLLYVGAAASLRARLGDHMRPTGGSTLRRALAGLLGDEDDARLTHWMAAHLRVSWCEHPTPREVEPAVVADLAPPLNVAQATEPAYLTATRSGYDAIAGSYAEVFGAELDDAPLDRALLAAFAETVRRDHADPLAVEVGSGPGATAAYLAGHGLRVSGVDLSPAMVEIARSRHPGIGFRVGDLRALDLDDASLAGLVSWYSLIHIPEPDRPAAVAEFGRVLRPGGYLLLAFQVGEGTNHHDEAFGHAVSLDFHRLDPDAVAGLLETAGFGLVARVVRAPEPRSAAPPLPQAVLIARKPS